MSRPKQKVKKVKSVQSREKINKPPTVSETEQPQLDSSMRLSEGGKIAKTKYTSLQEEKKDSNESNVNGVENSKSTQDKEAQDEEIVPSQEKAEVVKDVKELGEKEALK